MPTLAHILLAGLVASLAVLFFGDLAIPRPSTLPPEARPAAPLARVLPELPARNGGRFGKPGDPLNLVFSKPITPISKRHHFRLWRSGWRDERGREVWWGSGNLDLRVRWWDLSHSPDPDMDAEREAVARSLAGSPSVESIRVEAAAQVPREGANDKGYPFRTDGRVLVVLLKE